MKCCDIPPGAVKYAAYLALLFQFLMVNPDCSSPAYANPASAGNKAPEFELTDIQGAPHKLSDYRGRVVLLNFWATWCAECVMEIPSLNALSGKFHDDGLVVLGISIDRNRTSVDKMREKVPMTYPVLLDASGDVFVEKYTIIRLPSTIVIDRNGLIRKNIPGRQEFGSASLIKMISDLLKEKQP